MADVGTSAQNKAFSPFVTISDILLKRIEMSKKNNRTCKFEVLLTHAEQLKLQGAWKQSTMRSKSDYIRHALFGRQIPVNVRYQSQDELMQELILLKKALNMAASTFTQSINQLTLSAHLHSSGYPAEDLDRYAAELIRLVLEINSKITQVGEQWLR